MSGELESAGFVCGMQSEVVILRRALRDTVNEQRILCFGPGQDRAGEAARELVERGCTTLISAGLAGGLDPSFEPGDLIIADHVCMPGRDGFVCDPELTAWLVDRTGAGERGGIWSVSEALKSPQEKRQAASEGWAAVDMESGAVASVAAEKGYPFACLRVIADTSDDSIPEIALKGLDDRGNRRILPIIAGLLKSPGQLGALLALGKRSQTAHARLLGAAVAISGD